MRNGYLNNSDSIEDSILDFCEIPRSRAELISLTGKSRNYVFKQPIAPLVECGKLKLTMPEKPKRSKQKYVKA